MADDRDGDAPLADLAESIRSTGGDDRPADDAFVKPAGTEALESGEVWETIDADASDDRQVAPGDAADEHVVPKRAYCESCPLEAFTEPPEVACTNPGTSIVEFVDIDHLRVRNCPVVAERLELGEADLGPMTPSSFGSQ